MSVHPEFFDSLQEYVNQRLAEWDAQNPKPLPSPEYFEPLEAITCRHNNGYALLMLSGEELQVSIATPKGTFFFFMNTGLLQNFIQQLLTVENAMLEHHEWRNGGAEGKRWNAERCRLIENARKEFIAENEKRRSEPPKRLKKAPSCCWHCESKAVTKVTVKGIETYECADCRTWLGDVQEVE